MLKLEFSLAKRHKLRISRLKIKSHNFFKDRYGFHSTSPSFIIIFLRSKTSEFSSSRNSYRSPFVNRNRYYGKTPIIYTICNSRYVGKLLPFAGCVSFSSTPSLHSFIPQFMPFFLASYQDVIRGDQVRTRTDRVQVYRSGRTWVPVTFS